MNPDAIVNYLIEAGFDASVTGDRKELTVTFTVRDLTLSLAHRFPAELLALPNFELVNAGALEPLAHVVPALDSSRASVCVADADSISVNTDVPELAYAASLRRHINLIASLIHDAGWNRSELLREFHSNWGILCTRAKTQSDVVYLASDGADASGLQVKGPDRESKGGLRGHKFALTQQMATGAIFESARRYARWSSRSTTGKAILLRVEGLLPAPQSPSALLAWYERVVERVDEPSREALERFRAHPGKTFWLFFSAEVPGGTTSCAIQFQSPHKKRLPLNESEAAEGRWIAKPHIVRSLSRDALVPRGGGSLQLAQRSVLLVGCGSVGSEIAHRLASAGVGRLTISDNDLFTESNLYRHTLSLVDLGLLKSAAVAYDLSLKHPWVSVEHWGRRLEDLRNVEVLTSFDLIIIAIGSPTIERVFRDFCQQRAVGVPIQNVWVEAYGVGGHATLDLPHSTGCWYCAYVDPETLGRGLASNLNFLVPNQDLTKTHNGCGQQFLPYSAIAASYTATMAADLAVQYLQGDVKSSSKMSWRGDSAESERHGFKLTHRYRHFTQSLVVLPLRNDACDVCGV